MRSITAVAILLLTGTAMTAALAQERQDGRQFDTKESCTNMSGLALVNCEAKQKRAAKEAQQAGSTGGPTVSAADAKVYNETAAAANAKNAAKDYAGAAAAYQTAIDANPKSPLLHRYYTGLAIAQRQEAVAMFNNAPAPTYPPAGATNEQIRAANAANAAAQQQRVAGTLPLVKRAQASAARAASVAAAGKDRSIDEAIALELRQDASLLYQLDRAGVFAAPRAGVEYEAQSLRAWLAKNPTLADSIVAQFGVPTAAALTARDPAAGAVLADEVFARSGNDPDGVLGYAEVIAAAKLPATDPRRAKALAALTRIEPTVADGSKKASLVRLKAALGAPA